MEGTLETLVSYVPPQVARWYTHAPAPLSAPRADRYPGAALFADISGFTALTERLARLGPEGAEQLTGLLNGYFGRLVDVVTAHGGEVVKFAGDGLLAVWRAEAEDLATVTLRAAQCGVAVQMLFRDNDLGAGERLQLTIGIGAGDVMAAHVGGVGGRWEFLATGDPMAQVIRAEEHAQPGNVVLAPEAWLLVQDHCGGHVLPNGSVRLYDLRAPLSLRPAEPVVPGPEAAPALRAYVPLAVTTRLDAGHAGWLAELRRLTVLFLNVQGLDLTGPSALARLQMAVQAVQDVLARYEGTINKLIVEEAGPTCVAAFGLPPLTHEDDPGRALSAALGLQETLGALGLACGVGLATGQAFCGPVGGAQRREYTMIGDVVNVAARLMSSAAGDVWCDAATRQAARDRFTFDTLPTMAVKGKAEPVPVYRPARAAVPPRAAVADRPDRRFVGRTVELGAARERFVALHGGAGGVLLVEGEAGIGKSRLVEAMLEVAARGGITVLRGEADGVEHSTPYFAWRHVLASLFELEPGDDATARRGRLDAVLAAQGPDTVELAPLLDELLPVDVPDNALTRHMQGQVRADNRHALLGRVLRRRAADTPLVVALEDVHWMDSASWALAQHVCRDVPEVLLILSARPFTDGAPPEYTHLAEAPVTTRLRLRPLDEADTLALVCHRLGVDRMPDVVESLIRERAQGNPFFSEELAYALREAGLIVVANGRCTLCDDAGDLGKVALPTTVQGVVTSRIDRLTPGQQLALKAASVIGRVFAFRVLRDIYPEEGDRPLLQDYLEALDTLDLTPLESPEPDLAYIFKHIITQEVAYNLMVQAQREQLHLATAQWYERHYAADLVQCYPLLAHHWGQAGDPGKALEYNRRAGERAVATGASQDGVAFLTAALAYDDAAPAAARLGPVERGRLERQLGAAYLGLGRLDDAQRHLWAALGHLGFPEPHTRGGFVRSTLRQALVQALHLGWPRAFVDRAGADRDRLLEMARCLLHLGELQYFRNDVLRALHASVTALNVAERAGPSPELARIYAGCAIYACAVRLNRLAERYARLAGDHAARIDALPVSAYGAMTTGTYAMSIGEYRRATEHLERGIELYEQLGDHRLQALCRVALARVAAQQGDFAHSLRLSDDMRAVGRRTDNVEQEAWGLIGRGENGLRLGRPPDAVVPDLTTAVAMLTEAGDFLHRIRAHGLLAMAHLRRGDVATARKEADAARGILAQAPSAPGVFEGYSGMLEVYTTLWERGDSDVAPTAQDLSARLSKLGGRFALAAPRAHLWRGKVEWLAGRRRKARASWARGLDAAARSGSAWEAGLAHAALGHHLPPADPARRGHLEEAATLFERIGAVHDLERARVALEA